MRCWCLPSPAVVVAVVAVALAPALAVVAPGEAWADRAIGGTVVDAATGAPIVEAGVAANDRAATTDAAGKFRISGLPFSRIDVIVVAEGYETYFGSARLGAELEIRLQADSGSEVITVTGRRPAGAPLHLGSEDIRSLPGAGNDTLRALQSLPGVARTPFGLGGLALRGTAPRDTNVYLDGIEVPLLYHFGGIASFMPTAAVDEVELAPGGASTRYGRGLGGVAEVTSRTGRGDAWRVGAELSLIHAAAVAEGPAPGRGSWLVGVRRSYFDAIAEAASLDLSLAPRYYDAQLRWESGNGRWMAILFGSDDKLRLVRDPDDGGDTGGIDTSNVKDFTYRSRFARLGLRYRALFGATAVTILPSVGVDDVEGGANHNNIDKGIHRTTVPLALRTEVSTPVLGGTLSLGLDGVASYHAYEMLNTPPPTPDQPAPSMAIQRTLDRWAPDVGLWLEQSWFFLGERLELRPGLRGDYLGLPRTRSLDPRLVVHERLPYGLELEQSVGVYHSPPLVTDLDPIFGERVMLPSKAVQAAFGAKAILGDDKELSATVYYQDLSQLPADAVSGATPISANGGTESGGLLGISRELVDEQFGSYSYREAVGTGRAYGVELIARKNAGRLSGWIAYTYGRSFRTNPTRMDGEVPYVLDQPHTLTLLLSAALTPKWRLGGRFRYATGNPYTPVASATYNNSAMEWVPADGPVLSRRLPAFYQVDLRVDRHWRSSWGTIALYLDVQNINNRQNREGVTYNEDYTRQSYTNGLPVFPSIGVELIPK
jgi:TonB-dependent Receptor Plug Domain/Carboxypeptidase regulatory-like domain